MISKELPTVWRASLCNSAGELDYINADTPERLQQLLANRLTSKEWLLDAGDTIIISSGDFRNIEAKVA